MTIAHDDNNLKLQAGFLCVLSEGFDYPSPQEAYEAYHLAAQNKDRLITELEIRLSGTFIKSDIKTCRELVDEVDFHVNQISLGLEYFLELAHGNHRRLLNPMNQLLTEAEKNAVEARRLADSLKNVCNNETFFAQTKRVRSLSAASAGDAYQAIEKDLNHIIQDEKFILDGAPATDVEIEEVGMRLYFGREFSSSTYITFDEILHGEFQGDREVQIYSGALGRRASLEVRPA